MKTIVLILLLLSTVARAQETQTEDVTSGDPRIEVLTQDQARVRDLREWYGMHQKLGGTWPVKPNFKSQMPDEKSFLKEFRLKTLDRSFEATGSGNGGDPMAADFVRQAHSAISGCRIDEALRKDSPSKFRKFDRTFYKVRVRSVGFNLCVDDSSNCDFQSSFAAKNYPELNLILVNAYKYNMMMPTDRMKLATHEFLGIVGVETGTYGYSSNLRLVQETRVLGPGHISAVSYCVRD